MNLGTIKHPVYEHILDEMFSFEPQVAVVPKKYPFFYTNQEVQDIIQALISSLSLELKNLLLLFPITKTTLNKAPFDIMPA